MQDQVGHSCFLRLFQRFCLRRYLIVSFVCLSTPNNLNIFLRQPISNFAVYDISWPLYISFLRIGFSSLPFSKNLSIEKSLAFKIALTYESPESSEPDLTNSRDFGAFSLVQPVGLTFLTGSCFSLSDSFGSVSTNSGYFGAFLNYGCILITTDHKLLCHFFLMLHHVV